MYFNVDKQNFDLSAHNIMNDYCFNDDNSFIEKDSFDSFNPMFSNDMYKFFEKFKNKYQNPAIKLDGSNPNKYSMKLINNCHSLDPRNPKKIFLKSYQIIKKIYKYHCYHL